MKNVITAILALAIIAVGVFIAMKLRVTEGIKAAAAAESTGDYKSALSLYVNALNKAIPSFALPDINRSKTLPADAWKKEMEKYAAWHGERAPEIIDPAKRRDLLDAVRRNASHLIPENDLGPDSVKTASVEQYCAVWNKAFFARGVPVDPAHMPLATACFNNAISILKFTARTSFTYELTLIDTVKNRRTTCTVYPEDSTCVLAAGGRTCLLVSRSSYQPEPGKIWRSTPSIIPIAVPHNPSVMRFTIETQVKRDTSGVEQP
jgi:hypothetical protein